MLEAVSQFAKYKEDKALKKGDGAKRNRLTGAPRAPCPVPDRPKPHTPWYEPYNPIWTVCSWLLRWLLGPRTQGP